MKARAGRLTGRMHKKQDMITALERKPPAAGGAVPIWELEFHLWDKFSGRHLILGREFESLPAVEQEEALHANAKIFSEVSARLNFAAVSVPNNYWEVAPGRPAYFWLPEEARLRQIRILDRMLSSDTLLIAGSHAVLGIPGADRYEDYSIKLFTEPEGIDRLARQTLARGIETARQLADCGVGAVFTASDLADSHGPYYNPAQMDRFILPYLSDWAAEVKKMGVYAILHSDGNLNPYLDAIADSGIDALQAVDPVAGMDMRAAKDRAGDRICLCGNIDCGLAVTGFPEEVFEAARDLLVTCKEGGGLVLGASNALQQEVPAENYLAVIEAWTQFGGY